MTYNEYSELNKPSSVGQYPSDPRAYPSSGSSPSDKPRKTIRHTSFGRLITNEWPSDGHLSFELGISESYRKPKLQAGGTVEDPDSVRKVLDFAEYGNCTVYEGDREAILGWVIDMLGPDYKVTVEKVSK